jgi:hypothetical protein
MVIQTKYAVIHGLIRFIQHDVINVDNLFNNEKNIFQTYFFLNFLDYIGCFSDLDPQRQLTGLTQPMVTGLNGGTLNAVYYVYSPTMMTISYCNYICSSLNFTYTGLNAG